MYYSDSISKGFLNAGTYVPYLSPESRPSRWADYEDPTYLGFYIRFWFQPKEYAPDGIGTDYMPQGLLMADNDAGSSGGIIDKMPLADSAQAYLRRRNEHYRARMIKEFRDGLFDISNNTPWVFQKVTGLADLWKIDPKNNWRTKEKKITIECLDTISLKMSYLADLYRKAAWDSAYHRWILPDVQRFFSMEIIVTEMRNMQVLPDVPRKQEEKENSFLNQLAGFAESNTALNNIVNSDLAQTFLTLLEKDEGASPSYWSTGTFLQFNLDFCEFDFFSEAPPYLDNLTSEIAKEPAAMKMVINVGRVTEVNSYGLLGGLLQDTWSQYDRGKRIRDDNFGGANQAQAAGSLTALKGLDATLDFKDPDNIRAKRESERKKTPIGLSNSKSLTRGGGGPTTGAPPTGPLIPDFDLGLAGAVFPGLQQGLDTAIAGANDFARNIGSGDKLNSLGNVYGLTPEDIIAGLGALVGTQATQKFLGMFAGSRDMQQALGKASVVADVAGDAFLGVVDGDGTIGKAASLLNILAGTPPELVQGFIGAMDLMAQAVEGTPLQGQSVSDIMSIVASQNLQGQASQTDLQGAAPTIGNPGSVNLQAPSIMNTPLGKILFESNLPQGTPGGKVVLSSAEVNQATERVVEFRGKKQRKVDLEREELTGAEPSTIMDGSVPLTGAPAESSTDTKVVLSAAEPSKDTPDKRTDLEGPRPPDAFAQSTELTSPPKIVSETQESVRLEEPKVERPRLKRVDLQEPNVNKPTLGNADLEGPTPENPNLGNVNLD
jgi:hypothetical protein